MRFLGVAFFVGLMTLVKSHGNLGDGNIFSISTPKPTCSACEKPDWQLVFKAVAGIAQPGETDPYVRDPYNVWNREAPYNDDIAEARELNTKFKGHYKSQMATNWWRRNIQEVKISLMDDDGKELLCLIYDGRNSNRNSWFSALRLLRSPWGDIITEPRNICEAQGHPASGRRFYTNRNYGGCSKDNGWIVMVTKNSPYCAWEKRLARPHFLYSKLNTYANWNSPNVVGSASIFAIFVRTKCLY